MTRYEQLERLETASQPPAPKPATDPHLGATVANYEIIAEVVELIIGMTEQERVKVAQELAEHDGMLADGLASMLLDAVYDHTVMTPAPAWERMIRSALTVGDYVEELDD